MDRSYTLQLSILWLCFLISPFSWQNQSFGRSEFRIHQRWQSWELYFQDKVYLINWAFPHKNNCKKVSVTLPGNLEGSCHRTDSPLQSCHHGREEGEEGMGVADGVWLSVGGSSWRLGWAGNRRRGQTPLPKHCKIGEMKCKEKFGRGLRHPCFWSPIKRFLNYSHLKSLTFQSVGGGTKILSLGKIDFCFRYRFFFFL